MPIWRDRGADPSSPSSATPIGDRPVAYGPDHDTFFSKRSFERVENSVVADSRRPQRAQTTKQWAAYKARLDAQSLDDVANCLTDGRGQTLHILGCSSC